MNGRLALNEVKPNTAIRGVMLGFACSAQPTGLSPTYAATRSQLPIAFTAATQVGLNGRLALNEVKPNTATVGVMLGFACSDQPTRLQCVMSGTL